MRTSLHGQEAGTAASQPGSRVIGGTVLNVKTGFPLEGVDVTLADTKSGSLIAETMTDSEGRFDFPNLADGKFALHASHRGYIASNFDEHDQYSTAIVTGAGLTSTGLRFPLAPQSIIFGTVTEDSGDPVTQGRVSLYRQDERTGTQRIVRAGSTYLDDLGNYEFSRLAAGNYYIAVIATPWYATRRQASRDVAGRTVNERPRSPLDVAYATTYYPDVSDSDSATPIPVRAGERIPVNFTLHPVPAVHLSLQFPNSGPGQIRAMPRLHQQIFGATEWVQGSFSFTSTEGPNGSVMGTTTFEIGGIAPGHYEMESSSAAGEPGRLTRVDASGDHAIFDSSASEAFANVTGKVAMAGGEPLPSKLSISLISQQSESRYNGRVEPDGNFRIQAVLPGEYDVMANAAGTAVTAAQLAATGATVDGHLLKVGGGSVTLAATLAVGAASVNGFAKLGDKPASGVMIVLVPAKPAGNRGLFRRDQSDSDGSFTLQRVIPGQYTLVAIEDGWMLDWARPEVIGHYTAKGLKVTVPPHSQNIDLKERVEVQPK